MSKRIVELTVLGEPVAQGRPRFNSWTKGAYDPEKSRKYKERIRRAAKEMNGAMPWFKEDEPLSFELRVYRPILKNSSKNDKKLAEEGTIRPTTRPDADNYLKGVLDALSGIAYKDDNQVVDMHVQKFYSAIPRIEITIKEGG